MRSNVKKKPIMALMIMLGTWSVFAQTESLKKNPGINISFMDAKADARNDFFRFVNGAWYDKTEIPADRTRWGSFDELRQNTDKDALDILKEASANPKYSINTDQGKALSIYK